MLHVQLLDLLSTFLATPLHEDIFGRLLFATNFAHPFPTLFYLLVNMTRLNTSKYFRKGVMQLVYKTSSPKVELEKLYWL